MIRINLLGEKVDHGAAYMLQLVGYCACVILLVGGCIATYTVQVDGLRSQEDRLAELELELAKLKRITKQVEGLEAKKKLLAEKLQTIATLKAKKHGPVHILNDLSNAIPSRAWLLSATEREGTLEVKGIALDNQTIALFMNKLGQSPYFGNVDLVHSTPTVVNNVKLKEFVLLVQAKDPLAVREDQRAKAEKSVNVEENAEKDSKPAESNEGQPA